MRRPAGHADLERVGGNTTHCTARTLWPMVCPASMHIKPLCSFPVSHRTNHLPFITLHSVMQRSRSLPQLRALLPQPLHFPRRGLLRSSLLAQRAAQRLLFGGPQGRQLTLCVGLGFERRKTRISTALSCQYAGSWSLGIVQRAAACARGTSTTAVYTRTPRPWMRAHRVQSLQRLLLSLALARLARVALDVVAQHVAADRVETVLLRVVPVTRGHSTVMHAASCVHGGRLRVERPHMHTTRATWATCSPNLHGP